MVFKKIAHPAATPPALTFYNSLPMMLRRSNRNKQLPNYRRTPRASRRHLTPRRLCTHPWLLCCASTVSVVNDITFALVERLTGNELDAIHKFTIGKAAKGNVADKRAAVAAVLGMQQAVQPRSESCVQSDDTGCRARAHPVCVLVHITLWQY